MLGTEDAERRLHRACARGGILCEPFPGLFAPRVQWMRLSPAEQAVRVVRGAAVLHPAWVFCGPSAAVVHGLEVSEPRPGIVHVIGQRGGARGGGHVVLHHESREMDVERASGVRCTTLARTVADCVRWLDFPHALAVADSTLRVTGRDGQQLEDAYLREACGRHGTRHGLLAVRWADARAENGGESVARGVMLEMGFAEPQLQVEVANLVERDRVYRVDFLWEGSGGRPVFGELDGSSKYTDEGMNGGAGPIAALTEERVRESRLTLHGAAILRFPFRAVHDRPGFRRMLEAYGIPYRHDGELPLERRGPHR